MPFTSLFGASPAGPSDTAKLWRYVDLPKLLDMLASGTLFAPSFAKLDADDPWEGLYSEEFLKRQHDWWSGARVEPNVPRTREQLERANIGVRDMQEAQMRQRENAAVSCWRLHERESDAMWKAYTRLDLSVAIQTTYGHLYREFKAFGESTADLVVLGPVGYDMKQGENMLHAFLHKRAEYDTDEEVRLVVLQPGPVQCGGVRIKVDIKTLVERVWISPKGSQQTWFVDAVTDLCRRHGLAAPVERSVISRRPTVPKL